MMGTCQLILKVGVIEKHGKRIWKRMEFGFVRTNFLSDGDLSDNLRTKHTENT